MRKDGGNTGKIGRDREGSMRPFTSLISYEEAKRLILENTKPIERTEKVRIEDAMNRVLSFDVRSNVFVPPFDRSSMDGFAVKAEDTYGAGKFVPVRLRVIDTVFAGSSSRRTLKGGECIEIATGAPIPRGADAVVKVEETEKEGCAVNIFRPVHPGENVAPKGEDIKPGDKVLRQGELLGPAKVGVLSALGFSEVDLYSRPEVAIIPTGHEVQEPEKELKEGQVYDINSYTLMSVVKGCGCIPVKNPIIDDDMESLKNAFKSNLRCDSVVFSGGSSVGSKDIMRDIVSEMGEILFHGIQIKPGKPTLCAKVGDRLVFGMPGYPAACLTNGYLLLAPHLRKLARVPEPLQRTINVPLAKRLVGRLGRHEFMTVRLEAGKAVPSFKESGDITSLAHADGYIEIPVNVELIEKGEMVEVHLF